MSKVTEIKSADEFATLLKGVPDTSVVALYFFAPWAEPCKQMSQVFGELASTTTTDKLRFLSIDAEEFPDISESYEISAVPSFALVRAGKVLHKASGVDPKELKSAIEKYSGASVVTLPPPQTTTAPPVTAPPEEAVEEDLNTRLGKLVKAAPVMLFMKGTPAEPQCGFSRKLVALLRERGVRYGFFNILADDEVRQGLKEFSDWPTYPQLYLEGDLVGGLDIVEEEFKNDPDFLRNQSVNTGV